MRQTRHISQAHYPKHSTKSTGPPCIAPLVRFLSINIGMTFPEYPDRTYVPWRLGNHAPGVISSGKHLKSLDDRRHSLLHRRLCRHTPVAEQIGVLMNMWGNQKNIEDYVHEVNDFEVICKAVLTKHFWRLTSQALA